MAHRESAVRAKGPGIEGTSFTRLTPIVGDGMEVGGGVVPGNWSSRANVDECRGVIRGECANSNAQRSRWGGYRKRTHKKDANHQEDKPSSYQLLREESSFSHRPPFVDSILCS
jgi:hypothetical protein